MENFGKAVDSAAVKLILFTLLLIWFDYILDNFWGALAVAALSTLVLIIIIQKIIEKNNWKHYPKNKLYTQLALLGNSYTLGLYADAEKINFDGDGNYCVNDGALYFCAFRFSVLTYDDVAASYRISLNEKTSRTIIICNKVSREVMIFAATLYDDYTFITAADLYKLLKEKEALPPFIQYKKQKKKNSITFSGIIDTVFSPFNTRYYLFTGIILALMSFITPLKTYYIISASVALLFALIAKVRG